MREQARRAAIPGTRRTRRTRWRAALTALAVAGVVAGCGGSGGSSPSLAPTASPEPASPSPTATAPAPTTEGPVTWTLAWSDEFDGPAGAPPDPATWGYDLGDGSTVGLAGWGNLELQDYTASPANAATDGEGNLVISVLRADGSVRCYYGPCEYTSARLVTRDRLEVEHGRIEARVKVPGAAGLWPAFWMLGADHPEVPWPDSGEIDIMEFVGRRPNEVFGTIHGPGYSGSGGLTQTLDLGRPVADDFHVFAIDWRPGSITWSVDGEVYHEARPDDVAPNRWVFDQPFFMILNVAVGGNLGGPVAANIPLPQSMVVDYIRHYREATP
jgi:beta-glucanase (GH16 family)